MAKKSIKLRGLRVWQVTVKNGPDGIGFNTYEVAADNVEQATAKVRSLVKRKRSELATIVRVEQIAYLDG